VPVLWDRRRETIVSNESADIIRMLNSAFDAFASSSTAGLLPAPLRAEIDASTSASTVRQQRRLPLRLRHQPGGLREAPSHALFETLDWLDERLAKRRYLVGDRITEADWRLFTTLLRFDPVYYGHFKANLRRIRDYPQLSGYTRELYQVPGVAATVNIEHIKQHYYFSHRMINPTGIVPLGPELDLDAPHGRGG
jgi:glutathionyl-hydroquinone reductase